MKQSIVCPLPAVCNSLNLGSENVVLPSPPNIFPKMQKKKRKRKNRKAQFLLYKSFGLTEKQLLIRTDTLICE